MSLGGALVPVADVVDGTTSLGDRLGEGGKGTSLGPEGGRPVILDEGVRLTTDMLAAQRSTQQSLSATTLVRYVATVMVVLSELGLLPS